jgi:primase-polymerase (primpol)-like protein
MINVMSLNGSSVLPVRADNVPKELKRRPKWVAWRLENRNDRLAKVPYSPRTGRLASTTDLLTWGTFDDALEVLDHYEGLGFVFSSADPYSGIDLDECVELETGEISQWALEVVRRVDSYTELSPSGTGLHIFVRGQLPSSVKRSEIEMYSHSRFFTVTGHRLEVDDD